MHVASPYERRGNLPALDAVLREVRAIGVDRIVVGGDGDSAVLACREGEPLGTSGAEWALVGPAHAQRRVLDVLESPPPRAGSVDLPGGRAPHIVAVNGFLERLAGLRTAG